MNEKEEILFKMLKKDDFKYLDGYNFYETLDELLDNVCIDKYEAFKLGMDRNNEYIDTGYTLYEYNYDNNIIYQYTENELISMINDIDEFIEEYLKEHGEDNLYLDYIKACL